MNETYTYKRISDGEFWVVVEHENATERIARTSLEYYAREITHLLNEKQTNDNEDWLATYDAFTR